MKIEEFNKTRMKAEGMLFSSDIEQPQNVYFHGTSCVYSKQIEESGFEIGGRPFQQKDLIDAAKAVEGIDSGLAQELKYYAENPLSLSFASNSKRSLEYALKIRGGQTLGFVRAARAIASTGTFSPKLTELLDRIDREPVCVYAVVLSREHIASAEQHGKATVVKHSVEVSAIVAKVIIPEGTDFDEFKESNDDADMNELYESIPDIEIPANHI